MQVGVSLPQDQPIEQTFVSQRARLNGITLWLSSGSGAGDPATSTAEVSLFTEPPGPQALFVQVFNISGSVEKHIDLPVQADRPDQAYRVRVQSINGPVQVLGMDLDLYPKGQAYVGGQPIESDIAFRLTYDYSLSAFIEDLRSLLASAWLALPLTGLLILPGWLVLDVLKIRKRFDPGQRLGLSVGLSLSIVPIVMLWTSLVGIHWTAGGVRFAFGLLTALWAWRLASTRFWRDWKPRIDWAHLGLVLVLLSSLFLRFAMVRDLSAPAWVDSVHHALITRLITENGGYPITYQPYFDLPPTEYHAGYHSGLAAFEWLSGMTLPGSMLIYGQVLNTLAVVAVYLLGASLTGSRRAGLLAAVVTGFFTPMPAYYASWGRYSQLAGLLILPPGFALLVKAFNLPSTRDWRRLAGYMIPLALCEAGLLLVHYRAAVFLAFLAGAYLVSHIRFKRGAFRRWMRRAGMVLIVPAAAGLLLVLPWMLPNIKVVLVPGLTAQPGSTAKWFSDFSWSYLNPGLGIYSLWAAAAGLLLALFRNRRLALTLLVWIGGMFFMGNLGAMRLPLSSLISTASVVIMLFMPVSVLAGYLAADLSMLLERLLPSVWKKAAVAGLGAAVIVLSLIGAARLLSIINLGTLLFRQADLQAMQWIDSNIPEEETFLINPFNWGYGNYAGRDGGYWISPLTGRKTMPPPVLYGFENPQKILAIVDASRRAVELGGDPASLWDLMEQIGARYIYVGVRGGQIQVTGLLRSDHFELVYQQNGVYIFKANP